jgi:class 3 adenylate cyclase
MMRASDERVVQGRRRGGLEQSVRLHATVYVVVNVLLIAVWAAAGGGDFWPIWVLLGWGIGLGAHAAPLIAGVGRSRSDGRALHRGPDRAFAAPPPTAVEEVAEAVTSDRPALTPAAAPDGTVTILFSDIEGSTALNERLGDLRWLELLELHNRLVRDQVRECGGYEVKAQGDGFMLAFASARRAIECARAIQHGVHEQLGSHADGPVRVRIGLHTGEAIRQDSDYYGKNVVVASRIAAQARGDEILASSVVKHLAESAGDIRFEDEREVELPGLGGTHLVYRVV